MRQHTIDHPNAITSWETLGVRDGDPVHVLIVETDLTLGDPKVTELQAAALAFARANTTCETVVVYPIDRK